MPKSGFTTRGTLALENALATMQRRHGALLEILCVGAAFMIFVAGIIIPFSVQNRALSSRIAGLRSHINRHSALVANKERIAADYQKLFGSSLEEPDADPSVTALKAIERLAAGASVKIGNIRQNTIASPTSLKQVVVEFTTQARKDQYVRFLYSLGEPQSLFTVKKCVLQARKDGVLVDGQFSIVYNGA